MTHGGANWRPVITRLLRNTLGGGEDLPDDVAAELDRIEAELAALETRGEAWQPADVAMGGVILTIAVDGSLSIDRGYVRADDEPQAKSVTPAHDDAPYDAAAAEGAATNEGESGTATPFRPASEPED